MLAVLRRNPEFARLWTAQVISGMGDWLNRVAVVTLIGRYGGGDAALGVGLLFALEFATRMLPTAVLGPIAGPVADRVPRRALMVASDVVNALTVPCYLLVRDAAHLPLLYTLVVVQMGVSMFFHSARQGALPNTVPREDLHAAQALSAATWSLVLSLGSALGGLAIAVVGYRGVFLIDAATYVASALLLARLSLPPVPAHPEPFRWSDLFLFRDVRRGFAHVRGLGITPVLFTKTLWGGCGGFIVMLSVAGKVRFGLGADEASAAKAAGTATSLLFAARGLGTAIGPLLGSKLLGQSDAALRRQISLGFVVAVVGYSVFAVADSLPLAIGAVVFAHVGGSGLWVASTTALQLHVDDAFRGRVFALDFLFMTLAFTAGGFLAGWLHDLGTPIAHTVWIQCALVLVMGTTWTLWARRASAADTQGDATPSADDPVEPAPRA